MNFKLTKATCYLGSFVMAIVNNLSPLFFVIFRENSKSLLHIIIELIVVVSSLCHFFRLLLYLFRYTKLCAS